MSGSSKLAWELVREQRKAIAQYIADNEKLIPVVSEIVRLTALNRAVKIWSSASETRPSQTRGLSFVSPTVSLRCDRINDHDVLDTTKEVLSKDESSRFDGRITDLSSDDFLELLAHIHSIGSYQLPDGQTPNIPQRVLGAYYTPREVSDYIAELTLRPMIQALAKKHGEDTLRDHLKLIDPACGPGVFLLSAIRICARQFPELSLQEVGRIMRPNLYGVDLDEAALEIADTSLSIMCREPLDDSRTSSLGNTLKTGNSLISLDGWDGLANHERFFENPRSRDSFEWSAQFPEIFRGKQQGFDALLMNPPYERLKPNFAEFMRERLLSGSRKVHATEFERYKARLQEDVQYYRDSGEYHLANRHTLDTYRLFIERSLRLVRQGGVLGFIVPSTVLGDLSAERLRRSLLMENSVIAVNDFPEGNQLFTSVTQSVSVVALERGGTTRKIKASFGLKTIDEARKQRGYGIEVNQIPEVIRESMVIPRLEKEGWQILRKLHLNPTLGSIDWLCNRRGEFDLTLHKQFISSKGSRLLRGSHIGRYVLRAGRRRPSEFVDISSFHSHLLSSTRAEDSRRLRLACQQISNRNQRWRLKFALIEPGFVLANSCNYISLSKHSNQNQLYCMLGVLNSELMNWRFNISSTNNHVSNRELSGLPIPDIAVIEALDDVQRIAAIARECALSNRFYDAELEAHVFSLFGVNMQDAKWILSCRGASDSEKASVLDVLQGLMNR